MADNRVFKVYKDGNEVELYIRNPSLQENEESESVKLKTWTKVVKEGGILAESLNDVLKEQGIWNEEKESKLKDLQTELIDAVAKIKKGGIKLKTARQLALRIRELRAEIQMASIDKINYIDNCAEGQAQNRQFAYLVSVCTVYNDNHKKKYFASFEDYLNRSKDVDAFLCATKCSEVFYGLPDYSSYPENEFLKKYKFVDEKLRLINEDGHLIDSVGRLINEDGYYVKVVDGKEILVDENGNPVEEVEAEPKPFLDDNGQPIILENLISEVENEPIEIKEESVSAT